MKKRVLIIAALGLIVFGIYHFPYVIYMMDPLSLTVVIVVAIIISYLVFRTIKWLRY